MASVYILQSLSGRLYYGSTQDLEARLAQHARGHTVTTSKGGPWSLLAHLECQSIEEARHLERQFKRWKNPKRVLDWIKAHAQG